MKWYVALAGALCLAACGSNSGQNGLSPDEAARGDDFLEAEVSARGAIGTLDALSGPGREAKTYVSRCLPPRPRGTYRPISLCIFRDF